MSLEMVWWLCASELPWRLVIRGDQSLAVVTVCIVYCVMSVVGANTRRVNAVDGLGLVALYS